MCILISKHMHFSHEAQLLSSASFKGEACKGAVHKPPSRGCWRPQALTPFA